MSYALSVYLVPHDEILRFPGCADDGLLRQCLSAAHERLAELDEDEFDEDDEGDITHVQAFRELFTGEITAPFYGHRYGSAFELLCACLGSYLSNRGFSPCKIAWYEELDDYLAAADVKLRFEDLISNCPIDIPLADDFPAIGHWTHQQIIADAPAVAKLAATATDPDIAEALSTVNDWYKAVARDPGLFIVDFHQ